MAHSIQVHVPVIVEITVIDNGDIVEVGTPYINRDAAYALGDGTDTWDESTEEWRRANEQEWDVADAEVERCLKRSQKLGDCWICDAPETVSGSDERIVVPFDVSHPDGTHRWREGDKVLACDTCTVHIQMDADRERRGL